MFKGSKFQTRLFLYYSYIVILVVAIALLFFYLYISKITISQSDDNLNRLVSSTMGQVDGILADMNRTSLIVISNPLIKEVFSSIKKDNVGSNYFESVPEEKQSIYDTLVSINLNNSPSNFRTSLYNTYGDYISFGLVDSQNTIHKKTSSSEYINWYKGMLTHPGKIILPTHDDFWSEDSNLKMISILREIILPDTFISYGIVEVQCPYESLASILNQIGSRDKKAYLLTSNGDIVYPIDGTLKVQDASFYLRKIGTNKSGYMSLKSLTRNGDDILAYTKSSFSDWTLIITEPEENVLVPVRLTGIIIMSTGAGLLFITLISIFILTKRLTRPLKLLRNSVRKVTLDNLSIDMSHFSDIDEIVELNNAFDNMFTRLRDSMSELVQTRSHEMKAHMIALQSQMDPHFLYNMLSIINADSQDTGSEKTAEICQLLSSMLRYSTSYNEDLSPVTDELEHVSNYLKLMKIRFEYKLEYDITVDEGLYKNRVEIPKLTLQPLVENCFKHGFKSVSPPWNLSIKIASSEPNWYLEICDNGCGFDKDKIKQLYIRLDEFVSNPSTNIKDLKLGGMGLINTLVRLKLLYRELLVFKIDVNGDRGTKLTIGGPINVQGHGC